MRPNFPALLKKGTSAQIAENRGCRKPRGKPAVHGLPHACLFPVIPITDGASYFSRRRLLSITLFWSPLKVAPKKL
jgi:hypothetical protein